MIILYYTLRNNIISLDYKKTFGKSKDKVKINCMNMAFDEIALKPERFAQKLAAGGTKSQCRHHEFKKHNYKRPTWCDQCGKLLYGFVRQGLRCADCHMDVHHRCELLVTTSCSSDNPKKPLLEK